MGIDIPDQSGSYGGIAYKVSNIKLIDIDDQGYKVVSYRAGFRRAAKFSGEIINKVLLRFFN